MSQKEFLISVENTCDLPENFYTEHNMIMLQLHYTMDGDTYPNDKTVITAKGFYSKMREGHVPQTQQVNPEQARARFEEAINNGYDILHIGFSSALSGSCNSSKMAAEELMEQYPDAKIIVIDTLSASLGQGLLAYKALMMKQNGATIEETAHWVRQNQGKTCQYFTVDDLNHLYRGGRVSKAAAVFGTALSIKPVLRVDEDGKLVPIEKVRGRKNSIAKLGDYIGQLAKGVENDVVFISHGDCEEEANILAEFIKKTYGIKKFIINQIGPVLGAHAGPGTVALFFLGNSR